MKSIISRLGREKKESAKKIDTTFGGLFGIISSSFSHRGLRFSFFVMRILIISQLQILISKYRTGVLVAGERIFFSVAEGSLRGLSLA
jgi:hypothetical protein